MYYMEFYSILLLQCCLHHRGNSFSSRVQLYHQLTGLWLAEYDACNTEQDGATFSNCKIIIFSSENLMWCQNISHSAQRTRGRTVLKCPWKVILLIIKLKISLYKFQTLIGGRGEGGGGRDFTVLHLDLQKQFSPYCQDLEGWYFLYTDLALG